MNRIIPILLGVLAFQRTFGAVELPACAVLSFDARAGINRDEASLLTDRFAIEFDKLGKYTLVNRSKTTEILELQNFSRSENCVASECAVEAGRLLGVRFMVYGSLGKLGQMYTLNTYLVDVESGATIASATSDHRGDIEELLTDVMPENAARLAGAEVTNRHTHPAQKPTTRALPADLAAVTNPVKPDVSILGSGSADMAQRQVAVAEQMSLPIEVQTAKTAIPMRLIPAGRFAMGNPSARQHDDDVAHDVVISASFYMSRREITVGDWMRVMGAPSFEMRKLDPRMPVAHVSWGAADEFCRRLSDMEGVPLNTYRLPTEAEWEYACRAGTRTDFFTGNAGDAIDAAAWVSGRGGTHIVETAAPNALGLYDMHGNVSEWCSDWFAPYGSVPVQDPRGPYAGAYRIHRGGNWKFSASRSYSWARDKIAEDYGDEMIGFRIVRGPQTVSTP